MYIADLHNDVLQRAMLGENIIERSQNGHSDISRLINAEINLEVFVIWITKQYLAHKAFERANQMIDKLHEIEKKSNLTKIIKSQKDLIIAKEKNLLATPFAIEGGECLENKIENLLHFINRGLLYIGPTWNYSTSLASSSFDEKNNPKNLKFKGLTNFGLEVIKICNQKKVIIDVSHIGEQSFWDIIRHSSKPIIASHSCVYNLCPHYRNLKDEQILAIKKNNGVIFLNLYPVFFDKNFENKKELFESTIKSELKFISKKFNNIDQNWINKQHFLQKKLNVIAPKLDLYIDHIDYIVKLAGVDHVGIGSDYDGIDCLPKEFIDCTSHLLIIDGLKKRNYSENEIAKIMGKNFLRVYQEIKS